MPSLLAPKTRSTRISRRCSRRRRRSRAGAPTSRRLPFTQFSSGRPWPFRRGRVLRDATFRRGRPEGLLSCSPTALALPRRLVTCVGHPSVSGQLEFSRFERPVWISECFDRTAVAGGISSKNTSVAIHVIHNTHEPAHQHTHTHTHTHTQGMNRWPFGTHNTHTHTRTQGMNRWPFGTASVVGVLDFDRA